MDKNSPQIIITILNKLRLGSGFFSGPLLYSLGITDSYSDPHLDDEATQIFKNAGITIRPLYRGLDLIYDKSEFKFSTEDDIDITLDYLVYNGFKVETAKDKSVCEITLSIELETE